MHRLIPSQEPSESYHTQTHTRTRLATEKPNISAAASLPDQMVVILKCKQHRRAGQNRHSEVFTAKLFWNFQAFGSSFHSFAEMNEINKNLNAPSIHRPSPRRYSQASVEIAKLLVDLDVAPPPLGLGHGQLGLAAGVAAFEAALVPVHQLAGRLAVLGYGRRQGATVYLHFHRTGFEFKAESPPKNKI